MERETVEDGQTGGWRRDREKKARREMTFLQINKKERKRGKEQRRRGWDEAYPTKVEKQRGQRRRWAQEGGRGG